MRGISWQAEEILSSQMEPVPQSYFWFLSNCQVALPTEKKNAVSTEVMRHFRNAAEGPLVLFRCTLCSGCVVTLPTEHLRHLGAFTRLVWCAVQSAGVDIVNPVLARCLACLWASQALFTVRRLTVGQCSTRCATSKPLDESTKRPCGHGDYGESPRSGRRFRTFLPREDTVGKRVYSDRWVGN